MTKGGQSGSWLVNKGVVIILARTNKSLSSHSELAWFIGPGSGSLNLVQCNMEQHIKQALFMAFGEGQHQLSLILAFGTIKQKSILLVSQAWLEGASFTCIRSGGLYPTEYGKIHFINARSGLDLWTIGRVQS